MTNHAVDISLMVNGERVQGRVESARGFACARLLLGRAGR